MCRKNLIIATSRLFRARRTGLMSQPHTCAHRYEYIFKYIIIGDMGVGKSCLLHQFTEHKCT
jgi:hypothetical protein